VPKPPATILCLGVLDSRERFEFAVEKAVELGATHVVPLITDHAAFARSSAVRLTAKVVAAITQSGRAWLPVVHKGLSLDAALEMLTAEFVTMITIYGDALGASPGELDAGVPVAVVVGPEGGLSQREVDLLAGFGAVPWAISTTRLRGETAAVALMSVVAVLRGRGLA
jgi:16S rRNA (uracil1498-N3)-methyltransferase